MVLKQQKKFCSGTDIESKNSKLALIQKCFEWYPAPVEVVVQLAGESSDWWEVGGGLGVGEVGGVSICLAVRVWDELLISCCSRGATLICLL